MPERQAGESVLFVCSANQCRSPLAEGMLRARLLVRAPEVAVSSAGTSASEGVPATPSTVSAASAFHVDLSSHRSRLLDSAQVRNANLVIGMERRHVQEVVLRDPSAFSRAFTLKEFARRAGALDRRGYRETIADYTARVSAGRQPVDLLGTSRDDDLEDPTTDPMIEHASTAAEVDELVAVMAELIWNPLGWD